MKIRPERRHVDASGRQRKNLLGGKTLKILRKLTLTFGPALAALGLFAVPLLIPTAYAQEEGAEGPPQLDEIVVTSRKRDERLLDAPLTITVLTADDIEIKAIDDFRDIVDFSPGFFFGGPSGGNADRSSRRLLIRGMQPSTDRQTRQSASVYIDGAPVLGAEIGDTSGAERIEVIKGPQSAYFGRSSFGGAINIITKTPGYEWLGKVSGEFGEWGTQDMSVEIEGPLIMDKLSFRVSAGQDKFGGQYRNYSNQTEMLGRRETKDATLTFYATPTDNFSAKLRLHAWEDDDGDTPSVAYGVGNGEDNFNCNLGGTAGLIPGTNFNWICGDVPFPRDDQIARDSILTSDIWDALHHKNGGSVLVTDPGFLTHFGMHRESFSGSLILDYEFANGMSISSISAAHTNDMARLGDFDYRATCFDVLDGADGVVDLPGNCTASISDRTLKDFSQEIRLSSSADSRLGWTVGFSYSDIEELLGSNGKTIAFATVKRSSGNEINTSKTTGVFGAVSYAFTERVSLSVEARYQEDEILAGRRNNTNGAEDLEGVFDSFTPRIILDYKPGENMTVYGSYAVGNHPGVFNSSMVGLEESNPVDFACVDAAIFSGVEVPEETLDNIEIGFKGLLWDGRAQFTAATYYGEWRDQHNRGEVQCLQPDGSTNGYQTTGLGGETDMKGVELEFTIAATEALTFEATYAYNDTEILKRDSNDGGVLLGERELAGLGNQFSRYPLNSATVSGTYRGIVRGDTNWYGRFDFIYKSGKYATDANVTKTGDENRLNLRAGLELGESTRLEAYVVNVTDDDTFNGFQAFPDFTGGGRRILTMGLPVKRTWGVRATYRFGLFD
jgi:iron complex outermembrane receptor protein